MNFNRVNISWVVIAVLVFCSGSVLGHKTGKEIRYMKSCKILASKKKYKACLLCLKADLSKHYHPFRLFGRCMKNGKIPFLRKIKPDES